MIATPASLRSDFIHIVGMAIYIAPESTNHITGIGTECHSMVQISTVSLDGAFYGLSSLPPYVNNSRDRGHDK